jgi:hypothetical protein
VRISVVFPQFDSWGTRVERKLDQVLELLMNDPQAIAKIRAAAAKLKSDTDKLEGAVQEHSSEGQG